MIDPSSFFCEHKLPNAARFCSLQLREYLKVVEFLASSNLVGRPGKVPTISSQRYDYSAFDLDHFFSHYFVCTVLIWMR
ncbi:MAG: hypothetical protein DRQ60_02085 [Gammaproteobacteria bacterium]|nr:MAG: hypothetical protein DRQ60_02085 [Gammaproteobacteria bacterium]